jgi:hypothetical protein
MWDYYAHTQGGEVVLKSNGVYAGGNMPLLSGNAVKFIAAARAILLKDG